MNTARLIDTKNDGTKSQHHHSSGGRNKDLLDTLVADDLSDLDRWPNQFNSDLNDSKKHCFNSDANTARLLDAER